MRRRMWMEDTLSTQRGLDERMDSREVCEADDEEE